MMIAMKNDAMTTMTTAMTIGQKARGPSNFVNVDQITARGPGNFINADQITSCAAGQTF
jgi:hypothetical protein